MTEAPSPSTTRTVAAPLAERVPPPSATVRLLVCDDDTLTYADADRRSAGLAKGLLAAGFGKGNHIGLLHPNVACSSS